jgi:GNAT superfamily N-acetyltransferase
MAETEVVIRECEQKDFDSVMALVRSCYGDAAEPPDWWRWRHQELDAQDSTMFVAVDGDKIIGMRPLAIFNYFLQGKLVKGSLFSAVMVHPDYRRLGIFSRLVKACIEEAWRRGAVFVNTMPNDLSYPGFMKLGWRDPGDRTLLVKPLDMAALAGKKIKPVWLAAALAFIPQALLNAATLRRGESDLTIRAEESFDASAELLTSRVGKTFEGIILHRTRDWLNWRFKSNPWNCYRRLAARSVQGDLVGFAVTNTEKRWDVSIGYIVELVADSSGIRRALIDAATSSLRRQGVACVAAVVTAPELIHDFRKQRFFTLPESLRPKKFHTVYFPHPEHAADFNSLQSIAGWYQTLGDWDGI